MTDETNEEADRLARQHPPYSVAEVHRRAAVEEAAHRNAVRKVFQQWAAKLAAERAAEQVAHQEAFRKALLKSVARRAAAKAAGQPRPRTPRPHSR